MLGTYEHFLFFQQPHGGREREKTATPVSRNQRGVSYAEEKAQRESRLAVIFAVPLQHFDENRKQLVHEGS